MNKKKKTIIITGILISTFILSFFFLLSWYNIKEPDSFTTWGGSEEDWGYDIAIDSDDNVIVVGGTESYDNGDEDVVLIKFDDSGKELLKKIWGDDSSDLGYGIILDSSNNIYITETTCPYRNRSFNIILLKYSKLCKLLFNTTWGCSNTNSGNDIAIDSRCNIYVIKYTESYGKVKKDLILIRNISDEELAEIFFSLFLLTLLLSIAAIVYSKFIYPRIKRAIEMVTPEEQDAEITQQFLSCVSKDEIILFKEFIEKYKIFRKWMMYLPLVIIAVMISICIFFTVDFFTTIFLGSRFSLIFFTLIVSLAIIFSISYIFSFILLMFPKSFLGTYIFITDKKIYYSTIMGQIYSLESAELSNLRGISISKKPFDNRENTGTISFIPDIDLVKDVSFVISKVLNILENQRLVESIIYNFVNIYDRWHNIQNKLDIRFPHKFHVSKDLSKKLSRKFNAILVGTLICIQILIILIFFYLSLILQIDFLKLIPSFFIIAMFLISFIGKDILKMKSWREAGKSKNDVLIFESNKITLARENELKIVPFSDTTTLDFFKIQRPLDKSVKWNFDVDGFIIKEAYDSKNELRFGPIKNFTDVFEAIFCYLLVWKSEHGYLLSKEQLFKRNVERVEDFRKDFEEKYPDRELRVKKLDELKLVPIPETNKIYTNFKFQLDPNEKIYTSHKPEVNLTPYKIFIYITIGILIFIGYLGFINIFFAIFFLIFSLILCGLSAGIYHNRKKLSNMFYIFTNKKIVLETRTDFCFVTYNNISSISKSDLLKKSYKIYISLKKSVDNNPFGSKYAKSIHYVKNLFYIRKVPVDNNLFDLINKLRLDAEPSEEIE